MSNLGSAAGTARDILQRLAFGLILVLSLVLAGYAVACAFGKAPWLNLPLTFGDQTYPEAGKFVQVGFSLFILTLCFFLPTNARIMVLENSHRKFQVNMQDVAQAYAVSHRSDRDGHFNMKGEFDSIRERIAFLRDHPDLMDLEPSVLELAAQMSHISHELADTYSDNNVSRARDFLVARQQEIDLFNHRLAAAKHAATEIRVWSEKVEMDEAIAKAQLGRLRDEIGDMLPELQKAADRNFIPARNANVALPELPMNTAEPEETAVDMESDEADNITHLSRAAE